MSIYLLPKTVVYRLDKIRRTFLWQGGGTKKKYHLITWPKICKNKKKGGLGIKDIRKMNLSLLCKWLWKIDREQGLWQQIITHKYLRNDSISSVKHKQSDSSMRTDLLKVRNLYLQGRRFIVGNGKKILFWKDSWLYDRPISLLFPDLFKMAQQRDITLAEVVLNPLSLTFSRWLVDIWKTQWDNIISDMKKVQLKDSDDVVTWRFNKKGFFFCKVYV